MNEYKLSLYKTKEERKTSSIYMLNALNIDYIDSLPCTYEANDVRIKSFKEIINRYIANIISIQVAFDRLNNSDVKSSLRFFNDLIDNYGVRDYLNETELNTFKNNLTNHELVNLTWQYESLNVLAWVLGLKKELEFPSTVCDSEYLMTLIASCISYDDFVSKCKLINIEDILDELDLEYRYHWALVNNRINGSTNCGNLNEEIVLERRRALEWLFSDENDWNKISLSK